MQVSIRIFIIIIGLIFSNSYVHARFLVSSDTNYRLFENTDVRIIYADGSQNLASDLVFQHKKIKSLYDQEFAWQLDDKPTFILASNKNQEANGFATFFPELFTTFFNGGAELIDQFSSASWLYVLLAHETAHLYQLNAKTGYSQTLKKYLGTSTGFSISAFYPPFTYVQHPNVFLPTFILEGHATFNEGRFGNGGRLYNGAIRAVVFDMAAKGHLTWQRLINDNLDFPYTNEKYWVGGYFNQHLAETYGVQRTNSFFIQHSHQKFNPLQLNATFTRLFGVTYEQALDDMLKKLQPQYSEQKFAPEAVLYTSKAHAGFNRDQSEIRFLTTDRTSLPELLIYDLKSHQFSRQRVNMPMGRIFKKAGEYKSVSAETIKANDRNYGLFTEGYDFKKQDLNKIYYDIKGQHEVWAEVSESFHQPTLYQNGKKLGVTASSAVIGENAEAYYFTQKQKIRTLESNGKKLFSYAGYYGFPVEVTADDTVYFIGPTERGSGLFLWRDSQFYRLNVSDRIVDAGIINSENALVAEVTANGYEYKTIPLKPKLEAPFEYKYFYESEPEFQLLTQSSPEQTEILNQNNNNKSDKPYRGLSEIQYNGADPYIWFGLETIATGGLNFRFSDVLQHHFITVLTQAGSFGEHSFGLQYDNRQYLVNWELATIYQNRVEVEETTQTESGYQVLDRFDTWVGVAGLSSTFWRRPQWAANLSAHFVYENEDPNILMSDIDKKFTFLNQLGLKHQINTSLGYQPLQLASLKLAAENVRSAPDWQNPQQTYGGQLLLSRDLFRQTYLTASWQAAEAQGTGSLIDIDSSPDDFPLDTPTRFLRNTRYPQTGYKGAQKISLEMKQALPLRVYFQKFPLSLRRVALFGSFQDYYGTINKGDGFHQLFYEVGAGGEFELLFLHRFAFRLRAAHYVSSYADETNTVISVGM